MTVKEVAKHVIDALPDEAAMDDVLHALYVKAKFDHGESEIRSGRGVSHEEAKQRIVMCRIEEDAVWITGVVHGTRDWRQDPTPP